MQYREGRTMKIVMTRVGVVLAVLVMGTVVGANGFEFKSQQDPISDADRSYISTPNVNGAEAVLMWKCLEDGLNVGYFWGRYLSADSDKQHRVEYRFDSSTPKRGWLDA